MLFGKLGLKKSIINRFPAAAVLIGIASFASVAHAAEEDGLLKNVAAKVRISRTIDESVRVTLHGNRHPAARDIDDIGAADQDRQLERMILTLKSGTDQTAALESYLRSAHDKASPQFGKWLSPQQFQQHFGVAAEDIDTIIQWLSSYGFRIDEVAAGRRSIIFSGSVAQVRKAFHTDIHRYRRNGELHIANVSEPQIPKALADVVEGVVSLHDFHSRPLHVKGKVSPAFTSGGTHYMAAADFHTIYNLKPLHAQSITGVGGSIAVLGRTNVVMADMLKFRTVMNLPANSPEIIINGTDPGRVTGDEGESDLDLQWAGAVAPAAVIRFVTSASSGTSDGISLSAQYAVNNNVADIISLSYGQCEASMGSAAVTFFGNLWQQAAAQGITVLVSSGDSGAAGCDSASASSATHGLGVNGLCTSPYSTCVGGTQFADTASPSLYWASSTSPVDQSSALSYIPEAVWNESGSNGGSKLWATGGGKSIHFAKPSWQNIAGVPNDGKRDVPDVSLSAAGHDGYLVYSSDNASSTQNLVVFGGTSASAPSFAGIMALINQKTGYRQGNANVRLYGLASQQAGGGAQAYFHLITSGNNSVPGRTGFSASTTLPYYNQATGLGSVDGNVLVNHWTDLLPSSSIALASTPNPSQIGQNVSFTATVTGAAPTGSVQFMDGTNNLGSAVALSSGVATMSTSALAGGSHSITAYYSGDPNNAPSASAVVTQIVSTQVTSSTTLTASATSIEAGQSLTFTVTVSGASPTGTVQLQDGGIDFGPAINLVGGTGTLNTALLTALGTHSITAVYSGDVNNFGSTSNVIDEVVTQPVGNDADVPTLPEWGAMLFFLLLMSTMWRSHRRVYK